MRPHFIVVLTVLALCRMILPLQAQQRGPIIDMHLHAGPDDSLRQRMVALMDEFNIVTAFLSSSLENVSAPAGHGDSRIRMPPLRSLQV